MIWDRIAGLVYIIFGILLIAYPLFSSAFLSVVIGLALICFGISAITMGILYKDEFGGTYAYLSIILGIISFIFGLLFIFFLNALTFLVALQFYIVAFIMMIYGIMGLVYVREKRYTIRSAIILILGIITVFIAAFAASQPILIAILVGVSLIIEGVFVLVIGRSLSLIEKYG